MCRVVLLSLLTKLLGLRARFVSFSYVGSGLAVGSDICTQNLQLPESLRRESAVCTRVNVASN